MNVTCATLLTALKTMVTTATISVTGSCPPDINIQHLPAGSVLNFSNAQVTRLDITGLSNITLLGITANNSPDAGINIIESKNIKLVSPHVNQPLLAGVRVQQSDHVDVGAAVVTESSGDGFDIVGSTNVNVHDGICQNNIRTATHPDCVQMWSLPGNTLQHITVQRMQAVGQTQGYDNFGDSTDSSDIKIMNNIATVTEANCIAFRAVTELVVTNNKCVTLPGGTVGPAVVRVFSSPGAVVTGNTSS